MIGSFTGAGFWASIGLGLATGPLGLVLGLLLTLIISMLVCGSLNVLIERVAYRPLRNAPKLAPLITAVGFSFILQNVGLLWLGGSPAGLSDLIHQNDTVLQISGVVIRRADVLAVGVTIPLVALLIWFVGRTRLGKAMRATAQDPEAARLMGINVNTTISLTFLLGGMLAGAAGLVYALYETTVWYFQGFEAGLIAFTAAVMGGIGNIRGAVLGGPDHRVHPADLRCPDRPPVDAGDRLRLPGHDHGPAPTRADRRGDAGSRMSELRAQFREWRAVDRAGAPAVVAARAGGRC